MYTPSIFKRLAVGCAVAGVLLLAGCDGRTTEEVIPASGCRLENYTFTRGQPGAGRSYVDEKATYTYDARGNLTQADTTMDGGEPAYTYQRRFTSRYTYDAEGFLTSHASEQSQQYTHPDGNTEGRQALLNIQYTYAAGRLSGYVSVHSVTRNSSADGKGVRKGATTRVQGSYAYDAAGNLLTYNTRRTYDYLPPVGDERPLDAEGTEMTWVYRDNRLVDVIQKTGGTETHPATIVNGLVTRMNTYGGYTRYEYDGQDRFIRSEEYQGNQLISTVVQEWADGRLPADALPRYKGFPNAKLPYGQRGVVRKFHFTWEYPASGVKAEEETTYRHQFNAQGFVTATTSEGRRLVGSGNNQYQNESTPEPRVYTYRCR
jgi:YD repeat-containing protein